MARHDPQRPSDRGGAPAAETLTSLLRYLERDAEELAAHATRAISEQIPGYRGADPALLADIRLHVLDHYRAFLQALRNRTPVTREDLVFVRNHAARRVDRVSVADFVHAFSIGQEIFWRAIRERADDGTSREVVLEAIDVVLQYFRIATMHAAEVYLEHEQLQAAAGERLRRDLLDDLLAGRTPAPGPRLDAARAARLEPHATYLVVSAAPTAPLADEYALHAAATALSRAAGSSVAPFAVVRRDEIVIMLVDPPAGGRALGQRLAETHKTLAAHGVPLAVGGSTLHDGLAGAPRAYEEAVTARLRVPSTGGVLALTAMGAFEYISMWGNETARRLIPMAIARFLAEDAQHDGVLLETLRTYVAADLNVRQTAERLHIHPNTAHYRLTRIAEKTGCDLRKVTDIMELLAAARLVGAAPAAEP